MERLAAGKGVDKRSARGAKRKGRGKGSRWNGNVVRMVNEDLLRNTMIGSHLEWTWLGRREAILLLLSAVREKEREEKTDDCLVIRMNVTSWKQSAGCLFSRPVSQWEETLGSDVGLVR